MISIEDDRTYKKPEVFYEPVEYFTDDYLITECEASNPFLFDIECFENMFLVVFRSYVTGKVAQFEFSDDQDLNTSKLKWLAERVLLIGFNSRNYDIPMLWAAIEGLSTERLKNLSDALILGNLRISKAEKEFKFRIGFNNHIDLQQVAPSAAAFCSLKHYAGRMHLQRLQDLPFNPHQELNAAERQMIRRYCINDTTATAFLYTWLKKPIELRQDMGAMYGTDLRSLSDAQIAERVISTEIAAYAGSEPQRQGVNAGKMFRYQVPSYMKFYTEPLQRLLEEIRNTDLIIDKKGKIAVYRNGAEISAKNLWSITVGRSVYRIGIGGLHSSEEKQTYFSDEQYQLIDRDVASYYPAIILNQGLYPEHIGPEFLTVYRDIVERRLLAKDQGDKSTANSLKICINGCFGKLGSPWSVLYSPELLVQVTMTGQLSLLMLIEMLEWMGIPVVSANTDGVVARVAPDRQNAYLEAVQAWEAITNFKTEETRYASIHSRDVNNYIAIGEDGEIKAKGAYTTDLSFKDPAREALMKNPNGTIAIEAVKHFLKTCRTPDPVLIADTVESCRDMRKFLFLRRVNGGAVKDNEYLGKVIRWYMRFGEFGCIKYLNENKAGRIATVAETTGSYPLMDLTAFPSDVDFQWYIRRAFNILKDVGALGKKDDQLKLF